MLAFMAEKQEEDFMNTPKNHKFLIRYVSILVIGFNLLIWQSCSKKPRGEDIPGGSVSYSLNLTLPQYSYLSVPGNFIYLDGGYKGVLAIHDFDGNWYAFERACGWEPLNECARVEVDSLEFNIRCGKYVSGTFKTCCSSKYTFSGLPLSGPTLQGLRRYNINRLGNIVSIYN